MAKQKFVKISGRDEHGKRIPSRILEEIIHEKVRYGHRYIEVEAYGQHGIGGRLWDAGDDKTLVRILGHSGQRTGSLGKMNTTIEIMGPASDDVGWLNAGAEIIVHGGASNGILNGGAQGKVLIAGSIGARGMTMTKRNPRFEPPELWVLGSTGDYFGEFMAGGIAVVCGHQPQNAENILGYRPLVGMVGGKVFFRGPIKGFSEKDAKQVDLSDDHWKWLTENLKSYLKKIKKSNLLSTLSNRDEWQLIKAKTPHEKVEGPGRTPMSWFRDQVWDKELGHGGMIGDLQETERGTIPLITKGEYRRYVPIWEQGKYMAPCQASCPTGIPVQERWSMVRLDNIDEAISMGLEYTPFPATVCGYLCPSPCMASCTRNDEYLTPISVRKLGQAGENVKVPKPKSKSSKKIAVIGAGPGGISSAWHLTLKGHQVTVFDTGDKIGGKISSVIPGSRIPKETLDAELDRIKELIPDIRLNAGIGKKEFSNIKKEYDYTVVAAGAKKPRSLPVPGIENAVFANDFLEKAKTDAIKPGKKVVIIGAGNVGCDVATEAHRLGAKDITLIDIQKPLAFGKEKEDAEACGAKFKWPCFTQKINKKSVVIQDNEKLAADTIVVSIGDVPDLDFLGKDLKTKNGFVSVNDFNQTSDASIFAIGDIVGPGLITDAIGAGRRTAENIDQMIQGKIPSSGELLPMINKKRVSLEYYDPRNVADTLDECGSDCASCGQCKDCGICVAICPEAAIERVEAAGDQPFMYKVDDNKCIGCGFCKGACPCGIWELMPNTPM